jgi:transcriptional regulator with XRE-family HTH domain
LRHEAGLTQHQLAERAGIDRSYLARIECEGLNISINVVFALANALKMEPYGLFDDDAEIDGAA